MAFAKYLQNGLRENAPAAVDANGRVINAGYDTAESVHKVAMMVWNPTLLQWERATNTGSGGSGGTAVSTTKRFDVVSKTLMYSGEAEVGTLESATSWAIRKITFDANGNATASMLGVGSWDERASINYQ